MCSLNNDRVESRVHAEYSLEHEWKQSGKVKEKKKQELNWENEFFSYSVGEKKLCFIFFFYETSFS